MQQPTSSTITPFSINTVETKILSFSMQMGRLGNRRHKLRLEAKERRSLKLLEGKDRRTISAVNRIGDVNVNEEKALFKFIMSRSQVVDEHKMPLKTVGRPPTSLHISFKKAKW